MNAFKQSAFTLMELIVVTVVIAFMAGFAIPQYQRSVERAHARVAITNLIMIHAANQIYRSENGQFWPTVGDGTQELAAINAALNLNINANGVRYICLDTGNSNTFTCAALRDAGGSSFVIGVDQTPIDIDVDPNDNPYCAPVNVNCPY